MTNTRRRAGPAQVVRSHSERSRRAAHLWRRGTAAVVFLASLALAACGEDQSAADDAGTPLDAPGIDAPGLDAARPDAAGLDAAGLDAPGLDAAVPELDAPTVDAPSCVSMGCASGSCTLALDIDVPVATVSGRLTQAGALWPMTSTTGAPSGSASADFYLRAHDTGVLHGIASIYYDSATPHARMAGSDTYSSTVPPGVYDVVYVRGESSGRVGRQFMSDPVVNGHRVLDTVTLSAGPQTLDIDVPVAQLSGRLTQGGAVWPMTSTTGAPSGSASADFYLRAHDKGVLHAIASIAYDSATPHARMTGSDNYAATVPPGEYDVVYVRGEGSSSVSRQFMSDPVINGHRTLRTVTVVPGAQTLDIDVPVARVSGRLTQGGAVWPMTSTEGAPSGSASADFYLLAHDTHVLHAIASIYYDSATPHRRMAGSDSYSSTVPPGEYDVVYIRGEGSRGVSRQFMSDPVINGHRILRTVTLSAGAQVLDIDVPVATVSGRLTQGGASWPMTSTEGSPSGSASADFYLLAHDTHVLHAIASIYYDSATPHRRMAGSDAYSSTVPPGEYDLVYIRGENSGVVGRQFMSDPVINGHRILRTVTITPGPQTLDIDVPVATVSGRLTQGGSVWPMTSTSSGLSASSSAGFYLRAHDTDVLHTIALIHYSSTAPYTRMAGSDAYASTVPPGEYDLVYIRGENGGIVGRQTAGDPVVNGHRILRTVTIAPGPQTLDVDVPVVTVSGRVTQGGGTWPATTTSSGLAASSTPELYLRAVDTEVLHTIVSIDYGSTAPYTRAPSSDRYSSTVPPGEYELVYIRGENSGVVGRQFMADPVVNGHRVLVPCVLVP